MKRQDGEHPDVEFSIFEKWNLSFSTSTTWTTQLTQACTERNTSQNAKASFNLIMYV